MQILFFAEMNITQGKIYKYLGMTIGYFSRGKLILYMVVYIGKILDDTPEDTEGESAKPSAHHIFDITEDATKISWTDADLFHHFMAQLLYLSKRARPEIQMAVSFICTRVRDRYRRLK